MESHEDKEARRTAAEIFHIGRAVELHDRDLRNGGRRRHAGDTEIPRRFPWPVSRNLD